MKAQEFLLSINANGNPGRDSTEHHYFSMYMLLFPFSYILKKNYFQLLGDYNGGGLQ